MSARTRDIGTPRILVEQIDGHLRDMVRPRLEGLTDEEYFWDPTPDGTAWTVHRRTTEPRTFADLLPADGSAPTDLGAFEGGSGPWAVDFAVPEPQPAPFTTIAWRLAHVIVGVLAVRSHHHLGGPAADYMTWKYAGTAREALAQFDAEYERWMSGVRAWGDAELSEPCGPSEGPWAEHSRADLVAHLNRELIHHLAEVCLLRDLFAHAR